MAHDYSTFIKFELNLYGIEICSLRSLPDHRPLFELNLYGIEIED